MKAFDLIDKALIRKIQKDIPLTVDPYESIAKEIGCSKDEVLERLQKMSESGLLRRIGAILKHRDSGYPVNGMIVCQVPEEKIEEAAARLSSFPQVSHCYQRKAYPDWPYNLYAMTHGKLEEEVENVVESFILEMDIKVYDILYSTEELKKTSMVFFSYSF